MKRFLYLLFSPKLALVTLILFAFAMGAATFVENDFGTQTARTAIYESKWFELLMLLLAVNFLGNIFRYKLYVRRKWPILLFHLAFLIILLGAAVSRYTGYDGVVRIREGAQTEILISGKNYLQIRAETNDLRLNVDEEKYFSPLQRNSFSLEEEIGDRTFRIDYLDFIPDAELEAVPDPSGGDHVLKLVLSKGSGRETRIIRKGETIKYGVHGHSLSFGSDPESDLFFFLQGDRVLLRSKTDIDVFIMATQSAGRIKADSVRNLQMNTLHRVHDISFVPVAHHPKARLQWVSRSEKFKDNDESKSDRLLLNLNSGGVSQQVALLYRHGFLPEFQELELNGLKLKLAYGSLPIPMGFSVRLRDFQLERYPGSTSPSSYASEVTVIDQGYEKDHRIYMNHVLDHRGFRFYQASYDTDERGTVLAVNHDALGTRITYLGYLLMGIGMFLTLFWKGSRFQHVQKALKGLKRSASAISILIVLCLAGSQTPSRAQGIEGIPEIHVPAEHADYFGRILVQDLDGRIKPVNTLASEFLRKVSRKTYYRLGKERLTSDQVFLSMHLNPEIWANRPLIKVDRKKGGLAFDGLKEREGSLLSFTDFLTSDGSYMLEDRVQRATQKKPGERSEADNEIIRVDERFNIVYNVLEGFYLKIFPKRDDPTQTWYDINHDFSDFSEEDARFCSNILALYQDEVEKAVESGSWQLAEEKLAYIIKYQQVLSEDIIPDERKIDTEIVYNRLNLNFWLFQAYFTLGTGLLAMALIRVFSKSSKLIVVQKIFVALAVVTFLVQAANLILRWYISGYPPWSNGYEMLVFVSWALMLFGIIFHDKSDFVLPLSSIFTGTLLFVSYLDWINPEITTLMPVLKSYWLKIHVAVIISSYAPLALSALLGFMSLILMIVQSKTGNATLGIKIREMTYINELSMTLGLFLLSVGTFLGGVWANESWGRYWAWDPKETWALISIIVYAAVLHLRLVPSLKSRYVLNAASVFAFFSIAMTSFGVNYYLTGLHSYATGDPVPIPNFVYVTVILILVVSIWSYRTQKNP